MQIATEPDALIASLSFWSKPPGKTEYTVCKVVPGNANARRTTWGASFRGVSGGHRKSTKYCMALGVDEIFRITRLGELALNSYSGVDEIFGKTGLGEHTGAFSELATALLGHA